MRKTLSKIRPAFSAITSSIQGSSSDDFFIALKDPHKTWNPGDSVEGTVVLNLPRSQKAELVDCQLIGVITIKNNVVKGKSFRYVLVEDQITLWSGTSQDPAISSALQSSHDTGQISRDTISPAATSSEIATIPAVTSSTSSDGGLSTLRDSPRTLSPHRNSPIILPVSRTASHATAISHATSSSATISPVVSAESATPSTLSSNNPSFELPAGEHNFEFIFDLPENGLYSSLEFERGSISYTITATYNRGPRTPSRICKKSLSVICPIDISRLPPPKPSVLPVEVSRKKKETKVITSTVEIPSRGYLRGDAIPVKVTVKHIKPMKSLRGIVVTLSRISRLSAEGLELQSFRKDLSQTVSPLYTDPATFTAVISNTLRIPPDTFPTTKGHKVVSFQYCVEVVIDLAGKWNLKSHEDETSRLGFIDTDKLKRGRGVVSIWTGIVVGTERGDGKWSPVDKSQEPRTVSGQYPSPRSREPRPRSRESRPEVFISSPSPLSVSVSNTEEEESQRRGDVEHHSASANSSAARYSELAQSASNETEKQRLQRLEQALMPSSPPVEYAPEYEYPAAPELPSSSPSSEPSTSQGVLLDKTELERNRLLRLESIPDEDYVPSYERHPRTPRIYVHQTSLSSSVPSAASISTYSASAPPFSPDDLERTSSISSDVYLPTSSNANSNEFTLPSSPPISHDTQIDPSAPSLEDVTKEFSLSPPAPSDFSLSPAGPSDFSPSAPPGPLDYSIESPTSSTSSSLSTPSISEEVAATTEHYTNGNTQAK